MAAEWTPKAMDDREKFFFTSNETGGKEFDLPDITLTIPNKDEKVTISECKLKKPDSHPKYYIEGEHPKTQIVLHFTAGGLPGDLDTLTKGIDAEGNKWRVSVPFIIARDGKILRLWDEKYWAYHLGDGAKGGNEKGSKKTIAVELSNVGPLKKEGTKLSCLEGKAFYCDEDKKNLYTDLKETEYKKEFRGEQYFATFTNEQYESLITLLRYLTAKYKIPAKFLDIEKRYEVFDEGTDFKGIVSHVNYRSKNKWDKWDKWDLGPAFEWDRVINGVTKSSEVKNKAPQGGTKKNPGQFGSEIAREKNKSRWE